MEKKGFFITTMGDLPDTSDLIVTRDTLNNNVKLSDFGKSVRRISFFALTYQDNTGLNEPFWLYNPKEKKIEGSLPLDYTKASRYIDRDAQRLVCEAIFELFDKVSTRVDDFDFEALKKAMLQAVETNPVFAEKTRFRVYSDTGIATGDFPEFSRALDLPKYGGEVKKLFVEVSFFKKPDWFLPNPPRFDRAKRGLYISVVSSPDLHRLSSELDKAIEKVRQEAPDFDFELFKSDVLRFSKLLKEAA